MDPKSLEEMRFDVRLLRRNGWLEDQEREAALAALQDVSHKLQRGDESPEAPAAAPPAPPAEPDPGADGGFA